MFYLIWSSHWMSFIIQRFIYFATSARRSFDLRYGNFCLIYSEVVLMKALKYDNLTLYELHLDLWTCLFIKHAMTKAREELRAEEFTKFQAALMWSKKYCDYNPVRLIILWHKLETFITLNFYFFIQQQNTQLKEIMGTFLPNIFFHKIPANVLMREIYPLNVVPANIIMNA